MVLGARAARASLAVTVIAILAAPTTSADNAADEMAIVDAYLSEFDKVATFDGNQVSLVPDRCTRTGGEEEPTTLPQGGGTVATNALMFQHVEWHGERGRFMEPEFTMSDSDPYGIEFLDFHAALVSTYEDWRGLHGHPPLVDWDPMTPIPEEFAYPVTAPCVARLTDDPQIAIPTFLTVDGGTEPSPFWEYTALCDFPDGNRLGKAMEASQYHASVHNTVGGDMEESGLTLRDPVFWAWHGYLQTVYETWQECPPPEDEIAALDHGTKSTSAIGLPIALLGLLLIARTNKRRG